MTDYIVFANGTRFSCPVRAKAPVYPYIEGGSVTNGRAWRKISVVATVAEVAEAFINNARYFHEWESGEKTMREDLSDFSVAGDIVDTRDGNIIVYMGKPTIGEIATNELNDIMTAPATGFSDTKLVDLESFIQEWHPGKWEAGIAVRYQEQVYRVLQAHDSTGNDTWNPVATPALFGLCHTKNPSKAKLWVQPLGTSGVYKLGECYKDEDGQVWRQVYDGDNVYDAAATPDRWERA